MDIYSEKGVVVKHIKPTGNYWNVKRSKRYLTIGDKYVVDYTEILQSGSRVYLIGIGNVGFSCHHFENI